MQPAGRPAVAGYPFESRRLTRFGGTRPRGGDASHASSWWRLPVGQAPDVSVHVLDEGDAAHNQDVKMQPIAEPDNKPRERRLPNFRSSPTSILPREQKQ